MAAKGMFSSLTACFQCSSVGKESTCNVGDLGSIPGSGRAPGKINWQPTPVFLPGESHRQRSLAGYSPQGRKSRTRLSALSHAHLGNHPSLPFTFPFLLNKLHILSSDTIHHHYLVSNLHQYSSSLQTHVLHYFITNFIIHYLWPANVPPKAPIQ